MSLDVDVIYTALSLEDEESYISFEEFVETIGEECDEEQIDELTAGLIKDPKIVLQDSGDIPLFQAACTLACSGSQEAKHLADARSEGNEVSSAKPVTSKDTQCSQVRVAHVGTAGSLLTTADACTLVTPHLIHDDLEGSGLFHEVLVRKDQSGWEHFHINCTVMERILSSSALPLEMDVLKLKSDPLDLNVVYKYEPQILMTLFDNCLQGHKVSCLHHNPLLSYIFAVGLYKISKGAVALWNIKNLKSPERFYRFPTSVTALQFSKRSPNMLGIGFKNGEVIIIDVSSIRKKVLFQVPYVGSQLVGCLQWWEIGDAEWLTFTNGNCLYRISRPFLTAEPKPLIQATFVMAQENIGIRRCPSSFSLTLGPTLRGIWHPSCEPEKYVLASLGDIQLCNIYSSYEFFYTHPAHVGVVNAMRPSPFCDTLYLTCGTDGCARIWCLHIQEPLLNLDSAIVAADIRDVAWSPSHGTIVVGITDSELCIWDFHRKYHEPVSVSSLPAQPRCLTFSEDGSFLVVGTTTGTVLILGMKNMPFPETFKEVSVITALRWWLKVDAKYDLLCEFESATKTSSIKN